MVKVSSKKEKELIEDLKYENQMDNLQPWIKAIYKQAEKDPANPGGWSKWSLRPSRRFKNPDEPWPLAPGSSLGWRTGWWDINYIPMDGGGRQEVLDKLINTDENKNWEKYGLPLCYPFKLSKTILTEEEKRFVLLCNMVLGLGLTEEEFLRMSETDKQELCDRIMGL